MAEDRLGQTHFEVVLVGTSLTNSILGAALQRSGLSVLTLDANSYYGSDGPTLALDELSGFLLGTAGWFFPKWEADATMLNTSQPFQAIHHRYVPVHSQLNTLNPHCTTNCRCRRAGQTLARLQVGGVTHFQIPWSVCQAASQFYDQDSFIMFVEPIRIVLSVELCRMFSCSCLPAPQRSWTQ